MTPLTRQRYEVQGLRSYVQTIGEGEPVLLLHGWGVSGESFKPILERLARTGYACHALDLPGFGATATPDEAWDVPRYAEFVRAYLDSAKLDKVRLIGHSFGGRISLVLAATYPERVEQVVLVNSAGVQLPPSAKLRLYYLSRQLIFGVLKFPGLSRFEPATRAWFRQRFGSADYLSAGALTETFKLVIRQDLQQYARKIQAPTLLIWGDRDTDTPIAIAHILEKLIPDVGLVVFQGAGHYSYLERPSDFVRIVAHFFKGEG